VLSTFFQRGNNNNKQTQGQKSHGKKETNAARLSQPRQNDAHITVVCDITKKWKYCSIARLWIADFVQSHPISLRLSSVGDNVLTLSPTMLAQTTF